MIEDARDLIDQLEYENAVLDSTLAAREAYWQEVYQVQEQHIKALQDIINDLSGGAAKDFFDKLLWGVVGYGVRAAVE